MSTVLTNNSVNAITFTTKAMELTKKKNPPNPNGNPNFKKRWDKFSDPVHVRIPPELHSLFKDLTTAINSGKIAITDLENMFTVVPTPVKSSDELLEKLEEFKNEQRKSWGKSSKQTGEFNTSSPRWTKFNEFKAWLR